VGSENVPNNAYAQDGQELGASAGACRAGSLAGDRFRPLTAPPARLSAPLPDMFLAFCASKFYLGCVCVFITAGPITKLFAGGGGGEWRTYAMIDDEPRPVWMSRKIPMHNFTISEPFRNNEPACTRHYFNRKRKLVACTFPGRREGKRV
jgi:hypothetical protein